MKDYRMALSFQHYIQILQLMRIQGNLQPTSKIIAILLTCLGLFSINIKATPFTFSAAVVSVTDRQINVLTTYTISLMRSFDDSLNPTDWNSTFIPSSANATIIFPSQFDPSQLNAFSCDSIMVNFINVVGYTCILTNTTIIVSNIFSGSEYVSDVEITLSNIQNPISALYTSSFLGTIDLDSSSNSNSARVRFTPSNLIGLSISFPGGIVNRTSDMIFNFVTANLIPSSGLITIQFPPALIWARQISSSHLIPFNGALSCYGITPQINNVTINCFGDYSKKLVTISSFLSATLLASNALSFGVKGIFAPPTVEPIDTLKVSTCDSNLNVIDTQVSTISGLQPQSLSPFNMQSSLVTPMGVNNFVGGLTFSFSITDTITINDYFLITFPTGTTITFAQSTSTIKLQSSTYTASNQSIVMIQNSSNSNFNSGTSANVTFIRFKAPPSTKPSGTITFTILNNGHAKMTGSTTITAIANNYTLSVAATSRVVNLYTSYTFSFTMSDALSSSGYFVIIIDPKLCNSDSQKSTITTNLTISISGTSIKSSPSTQISSIIYNGLPAYQFLLSNLNTSSANIPAQAITITVNNLLNPPAITTLTSFSLSTYYSSSADLVANANYAGSIIMQTGNITLNSVISTATTTYTFTTIYINFKNTNPITASGYIILTIPSDITLLIASQSIFFISSSPSSSTYTNYISNNSIILQMSSSIPAGSNLAISVHNIMTQNTTKTTASFIVASYDSSFNGIDLSFNNIGLSVTSGNNFNSLTLTRGSSTNSLATNYTIVFEQIQSFTSVSVASFKFTSPLTLASLSRVFEVTDSGTIACLFTKVNNTYLQVTLSQSLTSTHTIIIQKVTNPPSEAPLTFPILVMTSTSNFSYIYSQMYTDDIVNTNPSSLTINSYSFSSSIYAFPTNLSLQVTTLSIWPSLTYQLVANIPSQFDISSSTCSSNITNLACAFFAPTNTLTISMSNTSPLPVNIVFNINSLISPPYGQSASAFTFTTFDISGYEIQSDNSTVIFVNNCSLSCRTCSPTNNSVCLSCYSAPVTNLTLLYSQSCISTCPSTTYKQNMTCIDCNSECSTCKFSSNNCSSCYSNGSSLFHYFNITSTIGACLSSCNVGTYTTNQSCYDCSSICKSCNSTSFCFQCQLGYLYFNGSCLLSCPNNTLTNSTNSSCSLCQSPCASCSNTTSTCLSCISGTVLFNITCSSSCPLPHLYITTNQTCDPCDILCSTCTMISTNCTSCNITSNVSHSYNGTCLSVCPDLYYSNTTTSICLLCNSLAIGCANCSSSTTCYSCDNGYFYFPLNQSCLNSTPSGYFSINGTLFPCNSTCNSCLNSSSNCTSCSGNLSLYQNQCISSCPLNLTVSINNTCQYCSYPCSTCSNSTNTCLSCASNSSLFYDPNTFSCVNSTECPNATFSDNSSFTCSSCNASCLLCIGASTNCSKCAQSYYLISDTNICSATCPNGTVKSNITLGGICSACAYPCLACTGTINFCQSCSQVNSSLFLNNNGSCVSNSSCQSGTYANQTNFICQVCISPCSSCLSASYCLSCQSNYSLNTFNNSCTNLCPVGEAPSTINGSSVCTLCNFPCSTCSMNISNCTSCSSNSTLYLLGNLCVNSSSCIIGTYANSTNNQCQSCPSQCSACKTLTNCSSCSLNYFFQTNTGNCVSASQCQNGTVSGYNSTSGRNECLSCGSPCQTCSINIFSCTSCLQTNTSVFLLNNSCVNSTSCPSGSFPDLITLTCMKCIQPCAICSNYSICTTCVQDYFLNGTQCLGLCPNGTYVLNQSGVITCVSCNSTCATCSAGSTNCTSCYNNSYLFNNSCINSTFCPLGTFANNNSNTCSNCSSPCVNCSNSTSCLSCLSNYSIDLGSGTCYSTCPNGTISMNVIGTNTCLACSGDCGTCFSNVSICTSCSNSSKYLYNGSCYDPSSCPNGTFSNYANQSCQTCNSPCQTCLNSTICQTCILNYYLSNNTCIATCPNGTAGVITSTTGQCVTCQYPCATCINSVVNCTSCLQDNITQLYFYNNTCYNTSNCPNQTYQNNQTFRCSSCISPCLSCLSSALCSSCVTGYYYNKNNTCLSSCPNGTLAQNLTQGGDCSACTYPCITCANSLNHCTSCSQANQTLYLSNGSCFSNFSCPNGSYPNTTTLKCETCISICSLCSTNSVCTGCSNGFYLNGTNCLSICPNGTIAQNSTFGGVCQNCIYPCSLCSISPSICLSCSQINSTLYLLSNGSCVTNSSCINGTYSNSTTLKCQTCTSNCSSCTSLLTCLTCNTGFYYNNFTCSSSSLCPNGTLAQNSTSGGLCQTCTYPCSHCTGSLTNCLSCSQINTTLFLLNGSCVANNLCQNGTYPNGTTMKCEQCLSTCSSCQSLSICSSCSNGFYLNSTNCVSTCPNGTVADNNTHSCLSCLAPCNYCTFNQTICLSCLSPFLFYSVNNTCLSSCPDPHYADNTQLQCKLCISPCQTCLSNNICKSCTFGFYLFTNGSCLSNCPNGYYNNVSSLICSICVNNCSTCLSETSCKSCSAPYLLDNNICNTTCPPTASFNISNICQNCSQAVIGCSSCNSTGLNNPICIVCQSPLILSQGKCLSAQSGIDGTLSRSLKTSSIFPLPFTITGSILFIACFMSKLQNKNSYVVGTAYSLFGFIQSACLIYTIIIYHFYLSRNSTAIDYLIYLEAALLVIGCLNIFGLFIQTHQLYKDEKFGKWTRSTCNYCCYVVVTILSCLFNYKFKMLIFTKLFSFYCLRAQLESVQKFKVFNVMSFLGVGHEGLVIYISAIIMVTLPPQQQTFLSFLDLVIINILNIILALAVSNKEDTFFQEQQDDGIKINKVFNAYDSYDVNHIEGDDQKKGKNKQKGLQSRDVMMDEDDEFTLSISDRDESNINDEIRSKHTPKSNIIKKNRSSILESQSSNHDHEETGNSLKRPKLNLASNNFSAVYEGDLSKQKRKQFQQSHHLSKDIIEKSSKHSNNGQIEQNKIENKPSNIFDVGGQVDEENFNNMIIQNENIIPFGNEKEVGAGKQGNNQAQNFNDFQQGQIFVKQDSVAMPNILKQQHQQNPIKTGLQIDDVPKAGLNPSGSQVNIIPAIGAQRQIKVYKGLHVHQNQPQDIEEIDLTISKKQRELIELRKSIRKKQRERQRSQQKKSRKNRSSSKDKRSRDAMSELGLALPKSKDNFINRGAAEQPSSRLQVIKQQMEASKLQIDEQLIAPVAVSPEKNVKTSKNNSNLNDIKQQISQSKVQKIEKEQQKIKEQKLQSSIIDEVKVEKVEPQKLQNPQMLEQINMSKSLVTNNQNKFSPIRQQTNNYFLANEAKGQTREKNTQNIKPNQSKIKQQLPSQKIKVSYQKFDKQLDNSKYDISPRGNQVEYDIQEMDYEFKDPDSQQIKRQQNIFEHKKQQSSFMSQEQLQLQKHKLVGFISKPHQKIQQNMQKLTKTHEKGLQMNVTPDSQNNPLQNKIKRINKQSIYSGNSSFNNNEDALDEMVDKTSRNQINKNRSHLIRKNEEFEQRQSSLDRKNIRNQQVRAIPTQQSRLYQDLNDTSTLREASDKDFTQRKLFMNRPPMQHQRPATTEKNRMYIAGLKQMQGQEHVNTQRTSMDNSSLKNQPNPAKTSYNMDFRGLKSRELQKQGESRFDLYPSSFSSNQIQLGSDELQKQPNKPIISRTARIRQIQEEQARGQQNALNESFTRKSMKSYKSRSIDRNQYEQQQLSNSRNSRKKSINREENQNQDLDQYYKRNKESPSNRSKKSRSRSKSRQGNSDRRVTELEKIYLQRLQFKK